MMKLMECQKCGGNSFRKEQGIWICTYCGATYMVSDERDKRQEKIDYYVMKAEEAFDKQKYGRMYDYSMKILAKDPEHSYAWLMQMYYYGMQGTTSYTNDLIEAGKNAIRFEKEDLQDTRERVNKAFLDWGKSGAFNARSYMSIFVESIRKENKWKHPDQMSPEEKRKEYYHLPSGASSQLHAAVKALMEVEEPYLTGGESGKEFYLTSYNMEQYKDALYMCESAIRYMKSSYRLAGFEEFRAFDYLSEEDNMEKLWQKIGEHRPDEKVDLPVK